MSGAKLIPLPPTTSALPEDDRADLMRAVERKVRLELESFLDVPSALGAQRIRAQLELVLLLRGER
jgi:hypothetical protein